MSSKLSKAWKVLRGRESGRNVQVFADDIFIVSYPKSGNTWTKFLIANLISESKEVNFNNVDGIIPDIYLNKNKSLVKIKSPRFLKSHEYFNPEYKKVIYIVRDPRDVAISYYYYSLKVKAIGKDISLHEFVKIFLDGNVDSYGSWQENVGSWLGAREHSDKFLFLKYEDMLSNTLCELNKIADFLSINKSQKELSECVERSSFENMRNLELQNDSPTPIHSETDKIYFMRSGRSGGWNEGMDKKDSDLIATQWADLMKKIGYIN